MSDDEPEDGAENTGNADLHLSRPEVVRVAREIAEGYQRQGLKLTVRQLYYQFVARGLLGSGQKVYKKIVSTLSEARLEGRFPMDLIEDRGRDAQPGNSTLCEDDHDRALSGCANSIQRLDQLYLRYDRWYGQENFVSVWVEKEALAGVFEEPCRNLGVGLFACRGYPSVSALYQWLQHLARAVNHEVEVDDQDDRRRGDALGATILYFGDHDPDGWEIPRSALRNLQTLAHAVHDDGGDEDGEPLIRWPDGQVPEIKLQRIALNMIQIRQHRPPPFDAKITSARYKGYVAEHHTTEAWELDALEPAVLRGLIRENVLALFDSQIHERNHAAIEARRQKLRAAMLKKGWFEKAVKP